MESRWCCSYSFKINYFSYCGTPDRPSDLKAYQRTSMPQIHYFLGKEGTMGGAEDRGGGGRVKGMFNVSCLSVST